MKSEPRSVRPGNRRAVSEIAYLLRKDRPSRPVFLLGAGASYRAGIPLADEAVKRIARAAFHRQAAGGRSNPNWVKPSDLTRFLESYPWYIREPSRLAENFARAVEHLLVPREFRREFFLEMIRAPNGLNDGYRQLADMMMRGLCHTVLTTNFDSLIVEALREKTPHIRHIVEVNRVSGDLEQFNIFGRNQVVYLHGAVEFYTDRNVEDETVRLNADLVTRVRPLLNDSPVVVLGYRGAEPSVMEDLLEAGIQTSRQYRHGIYWCTLTGATLHPNVIRLSELLGANFVHLEINGFDEFMADVAAEIKDEDWYETGGRRQSPISKPITFDEEPLVNMSLEDVDQGLVLATLARYCQTLHRAPATHENYIGLLLEQGLFSEIDGVLTPTVGCYLLFGRDVSKRFPHASVTVTRNGKQRRVFDGNLLSQFEALVEYLDSSDLNPVLRVKGAVTATEQKAYPKRVITEAVVNLLVHRDYAIEDFATIEVESGIDMVFRNPGGISERLRRQLNIDADGNFTPVRNVTEIRNPSLADIFFGIGSMDKAGSGLADVQELMLENGGNAGFAIEEENQAFRVNLFQPLQRSPGESRVARSVAPTGIYITNLLPFAVIPETVWIFEARKARSKGEPLIMAGEHPEELPLFVEEGSRLVSFADFKNYPAFVSRRGRIETVSPVPSRSFFEDQDDRRLFVWLLRKHWEFYLRGFWKDGLEREPKKQRAYFRLIEGERNTIIYDSTKRRGVRRDVVKRRGSDRYVWHENEGIAYSVVEYDATWAIQLKPFYMFTGKDGLVPLPSFERTARSTRRMRFDRNRNVDDDLTFWSRLLSRGYSTIQLSAVGVEGLVLSASYQTVEVPHYGGPTGHAHQD